MRLRAAPPLLIIVSGPSGVGKDTVIRALKRRMPEVHYAVTATTRPRRRGEREDTSYYFVSLEQYHRLLQGGKLLGPAEVHGYLYGAPVDPLRRALAAGKDVLLKLDVQGAMDVRRRVSDGIFVFISPPSEPELLRRLRARHTEGPADLARRERDARFELAQASAYDYLLVNDENEVASTVRGLQCIIAAERLRQHRAPVELRER